MSRGKKQFIDKPIHKKLSLSGTVVNDVEELLHDPVRGCVRYGAFGDLVTNLLRKWVKEQQGDKNE
jgi:hypothetical protein